MRSLLFGAAIVLCGVSEAAAVIVAGVSGTLNTTPPASDPGFANVGIRGSGSAVYLGHNWVLTDAHVGAGTTWFGNQAYSMVPGTAVQLLNPPGVGLMPSTDLEMFQISGAPALPSLSIAGAQPAIGSQMTMIGYGRDVRSASLSYWTDTWGQSSTPATYAGYIWAGTNIMRWGTALVSDVAVPQGLLATSETTFATQFTGATTFDAQATPGDSGGGVFAQDATGQWSLAGVIFGTGSLLGQPWGISVFGDKTWTADLSVYRSVIYQTMALPGDTNYDGVVNGLDLAQVASHWLQSGTSIPGDANHDGTVNGLDIATVASYWTASSAAAAIVPVPEPPTAGLAIAGSAIAILAMVMSRRRAWSIMRS